jgi:hypothetical protein
MNWEAGKGERGLKIWAKIASTTAQKVHLPVFTHQTALRVADSMLLSTAMAFLQERKNGSEEEDDDEEERVVLASLTPIVRLQPHYVIELSPSEAHIREMNRKGVVLEGGVSCFDDLVITALRNAENPSTTTSFKIYKDAKICISGEGEPRAIRAGKKYDQFGAFFDWVKVKWRVGGTTGGRMSIAPAELMLLYEDSNNEMCGIVQSCDWQSDEDIKASTGLTERWRFELPESGGETRVLRKIKLKDIDDIIYVIRHPQRTSNLPSDENNQEYVTVVHPRYSWARNLIKPQRRTTTPTT